MHFIHPAPLAPSPPLLPTIRYTRILNKTNFLYLKRIHTCLKNKVLFFVLKSFWQPVFGFFNLFLQNISQSNKWSLFFVASDISRNPVCNFRRHYIYIYIYIYINIYICYIYNIYIHTCMYMYVYLTVVLEILYFRNTIFSFTCLCIVLPSTIAPF